MRFFVTDLALFLLGLIAMSMPFFFPGATTFALAIIAAGLMVILFKTARQSYADFDKSVSGIKGLRWKPVFFSMGTLELEYQGTRMYYSSVARGEKDEALPVDYRISLSSGKKEFLEVLGSEKPGESEVRGDKKLYVRIKKHVIDFDSKYGLGYLRNRDGVLQFSVVLGFSKAPYPKDAKLADMTAFLHDYVDFASAVHRSL